MTNSCLVAGCERPVKARGWCNRHWLRWSRHGSPTAGGRTRRGSFEERLWARVIKSDGCWNWDGPRGDRRGVIRRNDTLIYAYRAVYETLVGPIPDGLSLDHLCRNPQCVNPAHLEAVTLWENTRRGDGWTAQRARATHCVHGHEFTLDNTNRVGPNGRHRQCRACLRDRSHRTVAA